ncbi:hypothetical protein F4778DRAFT_601626 [Xylariomycetidae sp. FL2044]|nr:hypothetical protein F4778DRAFT_601626 [Xylariomycetidae sp. FL2044]
MAFMAMHHPMDKDQSQNSLWMDNEELDLTADNFFDQFVTFDTGDPLAGGDLLEDPPSPSILLESLNESLANSSNGHDTEHTEPQPEIGEKATAITTTAGPANTLTFPPPIATTEASRSVPPALTSLAVDPVLSGGSISDSELLRLEGISLKSPKGNVSEPSSPILPSTASFSPRKHNRFVDSVYATIRRATHRSRPHKHTHHGSPNMMTLDLSQKSGQRPQYDDMTFDLEGFGEGELHLKQEPIDSYGLPLSPPLTGKIPDQHSGGMQFVSGHLDDPFYDDLLSPAAVIHPAKNGGHNGSSTPMNTPLIDGDSFFQQGPAASSYRPQPKQRGTSSAEWPMEGLLRDDPTLWSSSSSSNAAYVPDGGMPSPGWWEPPTPHTGNNGSNGHHHHHHNHHRNDSLNLSSLHSPNPDLSYDYDANAELSGLMIHMPQPRQPQAAVLSNSGNSNSINIVHDHQHQYQQQHPHSSSSSSSSSHHNHHHNQQQQQQPSSYPMSSSSHHHHNHHHSHSHHPHHPHHPPHTSYRRPRPRAPSSGARHHGSLTSPRKQASMSALHRGYLREESVSPTPTPRRTSGGGAGGGGLSVRKRRSWCSRTTSNPSSLGSSSQQQQQRHQQQRHQQPRTPSFSSSSFQNSHSFVGGGGLGGGIDFVNFTPSDKNVLMTGVAPSGSSKTKARREKEAMERRRKLSEAALKAVRAAGGDIDKLVEEGFVI